MIDRFARELIERWHLGFVATTDENGLPHVTPKGSFVLHDDNALSYVEVRSPKTLENIAARPDVSVNFVDILTRRGLLISGKARFVALKDAAFPKLMADHRARWPELEPMASGLVVIDVTSCTPLATPSYDMGADEGAFCEKWTDRVRDINIHHKTAEVEPC